MIRPYSEDDLDAVIAVWYTASLIAHDFLDEAFFEQERCNIAEIYMPRAQTWVYGHDENVVGFIALAGNEVGAIFVDPVWQGHGFGRKLMDFAAQLHPVLEVEVFMENGIGRRFYNRYGFVPLKQYTHVETGREMLRMRYQSNGEPQSIASPPF
jgi:putative acetyltransferase